VNTSRRPVRPRAGANSRRRDFLETAAAASAGAVLPGLGLFERRAHARGRSNQPNILFILVDEMRFPNVFPAGITTPDQFLQTFMPNTYELWKHGVKFANHHMRASQAKAHAQLIEYLNSLDGVSDDEWRAGAARSMLGYGLNVP
jgi:hypothetical protein